MHSPCSFFFFFFFNDTATTEIYTLSLHDALPICGRLGHAVRERPVLRNAGQSEQHERERGRSTHGERRLEDTHRAGGPFRPPSKTARLRGGDLPGAAHHAYSAPPRARAARRSEEHTS